MPDGQVLEFSRVTKTFGTVTAVADLSAKIEPGAVTGFLGPNGAGKTTSLRMLLGQIKPTSGTATIGGVAYAELRHPLRTVGAVLEDTVYRPRRTALRQLTMAAKANGISLSRVDEVISMVGLGDDAETRIGTYSLGMRQRLSVATALLGDPGALVLDEPANGLDPAGIRWMRLLMRSLADEGRTVLASSHVLSEIEQVADNVLVISKGRLVYADGIENLADPNQGSVVVDAEDRGGLVIALRNAGLEHELLRSGITVRGSDAAVVGAVAATAGIALTALQQRGPTLEDVFLHLVNGGQLEPRAQIAGSVSPVVFDVAHDESTSADETPAVGTADVAGPDAGAADAVTATEVVVPVPSVSEPEPEIEPELETEPELELELEPAATADAETTTTQAETATTYAETAEAPEAEVVEAPEANAMPGLTDQDDDLAEDDAIAAAEFAAATTPVAIVTTSTFALGQPSFEDLIAGVPAPVTYEPVADDEPVQHTDDDDENENEDEAEAGEEAASAASVGIALSQPISTPTDVDEAEPLSTDTTDIAGVEIFSSLTSGFIDIVDTHLPATAENDVVDAAAEQEVVDEEEAVEEAADPRAAAMSASLAAAARAFFDDDDSAAPSYIPSGPERSPFDDAPANDERTNDEGSSDEHSAEDLPDEELPGDDHSPESNVPEDEPSEVAGSAEQRAAWSVAITGIIDTVPHRTGHSFSDGGESAARA